jgi:hypothetical protein
MRHLRLSRKHGIESAPLKEGSPVAVSLVFTEASHAHHYVPGCIFFIFLAWIVIYLGLDAASQNLPLLSSGEWQLMVLFALHIAKAAVLVYGYTRAVDGSSALSARRVSWRFSVLVLAALASVALLLLLAIAVFSERG